jgi:TDG/mug DNA glycosylase family protein
VLFGKKGDGPGAKADMLEGARVFVLPNPSGLNAHFTPKTLAKLFRKFRSQCRALT